MLKSTLDNLSHDDQFVELFNSLFTEFDLTKTSENYQKCLEIAKKDYFLRSYLSQFDNGLKEILLENYTKLNNKIELKSFVTFFDNDIEKTKKYIKEFLTTNKPYLDIDERAGSLLLTRTRGGDNDEFVRLILTVGNA